jgi:DNA-binding response OmpR family regulator
VPDGVAPPDAGAGTQVNGQRRVLVIDDEALIRKTVRLACEQEGYAVHEAETGIQALTALESFRPDIILLDLMLPDISGFDICRDIRRTGSKVPILILSAKTEEIDVVVGLEIGADDYIVKPFRPRELLARIAAHLRKARQDDERGDDGRMVFRDLVIDVNERRVFRGGTEVNLTHTEFDLLTLLAAQAGKALSREKILNAVWGYDHPIETRVIDVHIRNLRRKIEDNPSQPLYILAVPGVGYRFTSTKP